jgi:hypothetical protein
MELDLNIKTKPVVLRFLFIIVGMSLLWIFFQYNKDIRREKQSIIQKVQLVELPQMATLKNGDIILRRSYGV